MKESLKQRHGCSSYRKRKRNGGSVIKHESGALSAASAKKASAIKENNGESNDSWRNGENENNQYLVWRK